MISGTRSVRPDSAAIDEQILDIAAGLFAVHGFDRTSIKQVADAAGYSKTGLLHRFPSKQALLDAVRAELIRKLDEVQSDMADVAPGDARQAASAIIDGALDYPGLVQFLVGDIQAAFANDADDCSSVENHLKSRGEAIVDLLAGPEPTPEQVFRTILALELICKGVVVGASEEHGIPRDRLAPLLLDLVGRLLTD